MAKADDPYTAGEATGTWDSVKDTPPRDAPGMNGNKPHVGAYAWNDTGNGQRLLDAGGRERLLYVPGHRFPWHVWDGNCWRQDRIQAADKWMEETLHAAYAGTWQSGLDRKAQSDQARFLLRSGDSSSIAAALRAASRHVSVTPDVFDTHPWLLPCSNGLTYDLLTGTLRESLREDLMSRCVPVAASREPVPCPKWHAMLRLVMGADPKMVRYLRQSLSLLLTGDVSEKCFWFWVGETDRGKTTVLAVLAALLGDYACNIPLRSLLVLRNNMTIRHDLAELRGARLAYAEEFKVGDVLDVGIVKAIAGGGGKIKADRKGEANEEFDTTAKLIIGTNALPELKDLDSAIRGRVRVLPFDVDVPATLKARGLPSTLSVAEVVDDLRGEFPGILQDLVSALGEWRAAGKKLGMPPKVAAATKVYLDNQDPLVEWIETCFESDGTHEEQPFNLLWWSFRVQSGRNEHQASKQWFGRQLEKHKFTRRAGAKGKYYAGPRLTQEALDVAEEALARYAAGKGREAYDY